MRAAVMLWRRDWLRHAFLVTDREVTKNIDGTETCRMTLTEDVQLKAGDVIRTTYAPYPETS